ncbi:MAG: DUF1501 domain-containing protein [Planctomycetota bacterium]|nr:DUF1501 domain-containing protein [Planctomycetota bacterium]MDA1214857.1 DUF1501 domain-containing protein [Planctomycetota bacterium]
MNSHFQSLPHPPLNRRSLLQIGAASAVGVSSWPSAAKSDDAESLAPKAKSIIIVFLTGAASHHDTFDMKPNAPAEIRGEFQPIATSVPGLQICEHLPKLAALADRYALIRTLSHSDNNHLMSTHHVLTGAKQPGGFFDKVASRDDWPCYAAGCEFLRPRADGIPSGVNLPTFLLQGPLTWPGQHSGFLGDKYDPWQITGDPNNADFKVENLTFQPGLELTRLTQRKSLLDEINRQQHGLDDAIASRRLTANQELAFSLLTSSRFSQAFELQREPDAVRDEYGRHTTGQSLLLARRLTEAGVPIVQVNVGSVQNWDNHGKIFPTLKARLLPPLDRGVAALLKDLESSGRLSETMVMMLGEFGRTPKINNDAGRDHWGPCFFGVFAGGGVQEGKVIGESDADGAYPTTAAFSPDDVGATVYEALGIMPNAVVRDRLNRPVHLNKGTAIGSLYS